MTRYYWALLGQAIIALACHHPPAGFPEWRVGQAGMGAAWDFAQLAVVGEAGQARLAGVQPSPEIKWPIQDHVKELYWCKGTLRIVQVIKGSLTHERNHELLWASLKPDCPLQEEVRNARTNIWLLRMEGDYLRPVFDVGVHWTIRSRKAWDSPVGNPQRELAERLTTVGDVFSTAEEMQWLTWEVGSIVRSLVGPRETIERFGRLVPHWQGDALDSACEFLRDLSRGEEPLTAGLPPECERRQP